MSEGDINCHACQDQSLESLRSILPCFLVGFLIALCMQLIKFIIVSHLALPKLGEFGLAGDEGDVASIDPACRRVTAVTVPIGKAFASAIGNTLQKP